MWTNGTQIVNIYIESVLGHWVCSNSSCFVATYRGFWHYSRTYFLDPDWFFSFYFQAVAVAPDLQIADCLRFESCRWKCLVSLLFIKFLFQLFFDHLCCQVLFYFVDCICCRLLIAYLQGTLCCVPSATLSSVTAFTDFANNSLFSTHLFCKSFSDCLFLVFYTAANINLCFGLFWFFIAS